LLSLYYKKTTWITTQITLAVDTLAVDTLAVDINLHSSAYIALHILVDLPACPHADYLSSTGPQHLSWIV